jgi:hypothetical protein
MLLRSGRRIDMSTLFVGAARRLPAPADGLPRIDRLRRTLQAGCVGSSPISDPVLPLAHHFRRQAQDVVVGSSTGGRK